VTRSPGAAIAALIAVFALIAAWNVARYPPGLGYDAIDHIAYAELLVEEGELPDGIGEYYTPPLYYALAGLATEAGELIGLGQPLRLAQLLNALLALGTALLVLALARELWPGRAVVHVAALGFFCAGALVLKTAAMFHPETLDLFLSTVALLLVVRMLVRRSFRYVEAVALGVALGAAQLVRAFSLWTVAVVFMALAAAAILRRDERRRVLAATAVAAAATVLVAGPWYAYQANRYTNPIFDRPQVAKPLWERRPASFYLDPGLPELVTEPWRPSFRNRFWPTLYAEGWGDYFGVFVWRGHEEEPAARERWLLRAQSLAAAVPTVLAVAGWLALLWRSRRRPELLPVTLLPLAGIAGMLYFTVSYPTPDGDVIKATYMLTTVPAWALCFGAAVDRLWRRERLRLPLAVVLLAGALVGLRVAAFTG
jgi:hypothetical protein